MSNAYLRINDLGVAVEAWTAPDGKTPADLFHPDLAVLFHPRGDADIGWVWGGSAFTAPTAAPVAPVIADVSSAQAKIALSRAGHLDDVKLAVQAAGGEVEIWFTDARVWQRANPHVVSIGGALHLSDADIDALFVAASKIEA